MQSLSREYWKLKKFCQRKKVNELIRKFCKILKYFASDLQKKNHNIRREIGKNKFGIF